MNKINYLIASLIFFISGSMLFAQENESEFTVKGQLRPRAEYRHGVISPIGDEEQATSFISNRARVSLGYDNGLLSMGISAQDVSIWGERPQVDTYPRTTGINEAWAKLTKDGFFAQFGRQQLTYDDDRILGTLDWSQVGRFHDALKLGYENPNNKLHLILAYNQHHQTPNLGTYYKGGQPYKTMQTAWYQYDTKSNFNISFLLMNLGLETGTQEKPKTNNMQTLGTNIGYKLNDLNLYGTLYYQTGKLASGDDMSAYMMAAKASYNFTTSFSAALGIDYLSGQKSDSDKVTNFDPLFGTHHKFYGTMDYFYASAFGNKGLSDLYASLIIRPYQKLNIDLTVHSFRSQQNIPGATGTESNKKGLGTEFDLTLTYPIRTNIVLQGGYSMMFGTDTFFHIKGGSKDKTQNWAFLSLNVNPAIFKATSR